MKIEGADRRARTARPSRGWAIAIGLTVASVVTGCSDGSPSSAPATPTPTRPAASIGATPTAVSTQAVWSAFVVPDGRRAQIAQVTSAGSVYLTTFTSTDDVIASPAAMSDATIVRILPEGNADPSWVPFNPPAGQFVADTLLAVDETLYVVSAAPLEGDLSFAVTALDHSGIAREGWPFAVDGAGFASMELALADDGSVAFGSWDPAAGGRTVHRLDPAGREMPGWPIHFDFEGRGPVLDRRGSVVIVIGDSVLAFGPDGAPVSGWVPLSGGGEYLSPLKGPEGRVLLYTLPIGRAGRLVALSEDGTLLPTWQSFDLPADAYLRGLEASVDGTTYLSLDTQSEGQGGPSTLVALGQDGLPKAGFPSDLDAFLYPPVSTPDGTVLIPTRPAGGGIELLGLAADGSVLSGYPRTFADDVWFQVFVGPDGSVYAVTASDGTTTIEQIETPG